jgi:hypothetical protein
MHNHGSRREQALNLDTVDDEQILCLPGKSDA